MKKVALICAVEDYSDPAIGSLKCCVNDATTLAGVLRASNYEVTVLLNKRVDSDELFSQLQVIGQKLRSGDVFLFFFAGHGKNIKKSEKSSEQILLFSKVDSSFLNADDLLGAPGFVSCGVLLKKTMSWEPKINRVFIFDACRSELTRGSPGSAGSVDGFYVEGLARDVKLSFGKSSLLLDSVVIINSCCEGQVANEIPAINHGLMTSALLDELREAQDNGRNIVTDEVFIKSLEKRMEAKQSRHLKGVSPQRPYRSGGIVCLHTPSSARPQERKIFTNDDDDINIPEINEVWSSSHDIDTKPSSEDVIELASQDGVGYFLDIDVEQSLLRFRWIPPGNFTMGSEDDLFNEDETPAHQVKISRGFWMCEVACSQAVWVAVTKEKNPSYFKGGWIRKDLSLPVESISWEDIVGKFLPKFHAYLPPEWEAKLPTEAQWEYACRAGSVAAYSFGENPDGNHMNYCGSQEDMDSKKTLPVKSLAPNRWGLYQMHGNVWEWCLDGKRVYRSGYVADPVGKIARSKGTAVLRGGSCFLGKEDARSACRYEVSRMASFKGYGFRLILQRKDESMG